MLFNAEVEMLIYRQIADLFYFWLKISQILGIKSWNLEIESQSY